ncbi:MAG: CRISPR system precrRNA processing endoribonuclease RAMP protein Cas6 [Thermoanaerobaculia bacterium]
MKRDSSPNTSKYPTRRLATLRRVTWERWSQRQNTAMKLGGLVGTLTLEGDLAPFAPLLRAAEILHAGKGAVFGLGKIEVAPA